jgi:hypothetical protein
MQPGLLEYSLNNSVTFCASIPEDSELQTNDNFPSNSMTASAASESVTDQPVKKEYKTNLRLEK